MYKRKVVSRTLASALRSAHANSQHTGALMLRPLLLISGIITAAAAPAAEEGPPSRRIGPVLGWDVECAMRADDQAITSCGLLLKEGNLKILVGVDRSINHTVSKDCGHPHNYWVRRGRISGKADITLLLNDVVIGARFDGKAGNDICVKQSVPSSIAFENLRTVLMMLRTFPPSPENKGMWLK